MRALNRSLLLSLILTCVSVLPGMRAETLPGPGLIRAADNRIFAQQLVEHLMAENADLLGVGLHAIPPNGTDYVIVAQVRDIIGTKSSAADLEIIQRDETRIYPDMLGDLPRMKALAPLRDRSGRIIGLAALSFKRGPSADKLAIHQRLQAILAELSALIPDQAALFQPRS